MTYEPLTDEEVRILGTRLDTLFIGANSVPEMYRKLNTLVKNGSPNWVLLRSPWWVKGFLIAIVVKPRAD